jgi:hypothetical protein
MLLTVRIGIATVAQLSDTDIVAVAAEVLVTPVWSSAAKLAEKGDVLPLKLTIVFHGDPEGVMVAMLNPPTLASS